VENEGIGESPAPGVVGNGAMFLTGSEGGGKSLGAGKVGSWAWLGAGTAVAIKVIRVKPAMGGFRRLLIPLPVIPIRQNISKGLFGLTFK
jgi:hypothetical protein